MTTTTSKPSFEFHNSDNTGVVYNKRASIIGRAGVVNGNIQATSIADLTFAEPAEDIEFTVQVISVDKGYPHGLYCVSCEGRFEEGQVVLAGQKRLIGWLGWHTRCLKAIMNDSPMDEYEVIKQKLDNGEDIFE